MYYTEEQIEEVRSKSDIVQIIGRYVNLKRTGSSYVGLCPFHSEKSPSFNVSPSRQMYKCFGCGVAGNVITFIMEYENYTFPEAMEFLAEQAGVTISKSELSPEMKREKNLRTELVQINAKAASYYYAKLKSPAGKTGYEYFLSRGLSEETIRHFGLGYAGHALRFQPRQRKSYEPKRPHGNDLLLQSLHGDRAEHGAHRAYQH